MGTWFITGCSSGLGKGIARASLESGENVAVTARDPEKIRELTETGLFHERFLKV